MTLDLLDPVPHSVRVELQRLATRWAQLPLDQALCHVGRVHELCVRLATVDAANRGCRQPTAEHLTGLGQPDPGLVIDQLAALVFDTASTPSGRAALTELAAELSSLRALLHADNART